MLQSEEPTTRKLGVAPSAHERVFALDLAQSRGALDQSFLQRQRVLSFRVKAQFLRSGKHYIVAQVARNRGFVRVEVTGEGLHANVTLALLCSTGTRGGAKVAVIEPGLVMRARVAAQSVRIRKRLGAKRALERPSAVRSSEVDLRVLG